jgi:hypothetical protein
MNKYVRAHLRSMYKRCGGGEREDKGEVAISFSPWHASRAGAKGCHATTLYVSGGGRVFLLHQRTNASSTCSPVPAETRTHCKIGDSPRAVHDTLRA